MFFDPNDTAFVHSHSALRICVTAPTDPAISRTFDICQGAPLSWLGESFLLAIGRGRPDGPDEEHGWWGDVASLVPRPAWPLYDADFIAEPTATLNIPGILGDCTVEVLTESSPSIVGDPHVRIVDTTPDPPQATRIWESAPATFHPEHVQHELTRAFGIIIPDRDTVCSRELGRAFGRASLLRSLAEALPPVRRLALHHHPGMRCSALRARCGSSVASGAVSYPSRAPESYRQIPSAPFANSAEACRVPGATRALARETMRRHWLCSRSPTVRRQHP